MSGSSGGLKYNAGTIGHEIIETASDPIPLLPGGWRLNEPFSDPPGNFELCDFCNDPTRTNSTGGAGGLATGDQMRELLHIQMALMEIRIGVTSMVDAILPVQWIWTSKDQPTIKRITVAAIWLKHQN
jgi:hypothetical protein